MSFNDSAILRMQYFRWALAALWVVFVSIVGSIVGIILMRNPRVVQWCGAALGWGVKTVFGFKVEVLNSEYLRVSEPTVFIGNHQSALDIATFGYLIPPKTVSVGKRELLFVPFFGLLFFITGNLLLNRKNRAQSVEAMNSIKNKIHRLGISVVLFPEGTRNRTPANGLLPFKRGAFHLATGADIPIVPIVCGPIHNILKQSGQVLRLSVLPPRKLLQGMSNELTPQIKAIREEMNNEYNRLAANP